MAAVEYFMTYDFATGTERWKASGAPGVSKIQNLPAGFGIVEVDENEYLGNLVEVDIVRLRASVWEQIKLHRDRVINGGAPTPIGVVDTLEDPDEGITSRSNLSGAALAALIAQINSQPFSISWTAADNSVHSLDAAGIIAVGLAVMQHTSAAHDNARTLRLAIETALTQAEVLQVDYFSGWPANS